MAEMSGPELAEEIKELRPHLPLLLMSGHSEEMVGRLADEGSSRGDDGSVEFIPKPFTPEALARRIRTILEV